MTDRPLDLRPHEVRAALDGRLSLIVRPLEPQPWNPERESDPDFEGWKSHEVFQNQCRRGMMSHVFGIGTTLWGREAWRFHSIANLCKPSIMQATDGRQYEADGEREGDLSSNGGFIPGRLRPSITMPRWASRLTLTVSDVDVKRVQEIRGEECLLYGFYPTTVDLFGHKAFRKFWNATHGPDAWDRNPWCAFYSVTVHPTNIDMEG